MRGRQKQLAVVIAYGLKDNEKNVADLIDKLLNVKDKNLIINIFVGWNNLGYVGKKFNSPEKKVDSPLWLHDRDGVRVFHITEEDKFNSKAYYTWHGILKKININDFDYFLFVKDTFRDDLDLDFLIRNDFSTSIYDYYTETARAYRGFAYRYDNEGKKLRVPITKFLFLKKGILMSIYDKFFKVSFRGRLCKKQFLILKVLKDLETPIHFYKKNVTFDFDKETDRFLTLHNNA